LAGGAVIATAFFIYLLPKPGAGYVIYNISESSCLRLLEDAIRAQRLSGEWADHSWTSDCGGLTIHVRKFALLRNVTLGIEARSPQARRWAQHLGDELHARLDRVAQLPSTMGACLVLVGAGLLILPMWMVGRHIQDLAEAISHLFG
jgi:hypothetical protein